MNIALAVLDKYGVFFFSSPKLSDLDAVVPLRRERKMRFQISRSARDNVCKVAVWRFGDLLCVYVET
jgi:hypothetical protein